MPDPEPKAVVLEEPKQGIAGGEMVKGMHWELPELKTFPCKACRYKKYCSCAVVLRKWKEPLETSNAEGVLPQS